MRLSDSEWKIADCLWDKGSMTITELTKALNPDTGWSKNTVITLLKRMIEKGAVTYVQEEKAKRFCTAIDRTEAEMEETASFLDKVYKGNVGLMISNLIGSEKLTEEQIRFMLSKYASLSITSAAHREKLSESLIGSILLYDSGKIIITFNYRDKKEEANIDEIAASAEHTGSDIAQDGSPNSNNPNFVIIGDAFGFSVYFNFDPFLLNKPQY